MGRVNIVDMPKDLAGLVARAEAGETIELIRRGRVVARLVGPEDAAMNQKATSGQPVTLAMLRALTEGQPRSDLGAGDFVRAMRDSDRY